MQSKAVASKVLTFWLANRATTFAQRPDATKADRIMAICLYAYSKMIMVMDEADHLMTERQAADFHGWVIKHLHSYIWLHGHGMMPGAARTMPGRRCWLLLPKLHHLWHLSWDTLQNRVNPKTCLLLSAESFIGDIGRVARSCHRSTVSIRTLERCAVKMALKIEALKEELRGN